MPTNTVISKGQVTLQRKSGTSYIRKQAAGSNS